MLPGNERWESTQFNSRLQATQIALGATQGSTNLLDLDYSYGTTANNGNVLSQTITVPTVGASSGFAAVQTYNYDSLNRLKDAIENITPNGGSQTQSWKQTFTFDRYGNRRFDESNTTMPVSFTNGALTNPTISTSTNRLTSIGWAYDSTGNTTDDPNGREFIYDAENKQAKVLDNQDDTVGEYFYDGDEKRVKKVVPSTGETTVFVYDAVGKLIEEYSTIVASSNDAKVGYVTNDHLGSPRINTDANGAVTSRHDYHPFGEEIATSQRTTGLGYADDTVRKQFTGYERDDETEIDYAQARYYNKQYGKFTTTDPLLASAVSAAPQTWNRFSYVVNNPLAYVDPSGQCTAPSLGKGQVGICIEAFISTPRLPGSSIAHGDGRTFDGNNDSLTYRLQVHIVLTANKEGVYADTYVKAGWSEITVASGGKREGESAHETTIGFKGSANAKSSGEFRRDPGSADFGTTKLNVTGTATNGVTATGERLEGSADPIMAKIGKEMKANAPGGTIDFSMNFKITGKGDVEWAGGQSKGYPSFAAYSYARDSNGSIVVNELRIRPEGQLEDLKKPMSPIP